MDMSDDWADEPDLPEHVPPQEDRLWSHPSEYRGPHKEQSRRIVVFLSALGLILVGLIVAKTAWPTTTIDQKTKATPTSTLSIGTSTSNHIEDLAKALVAIELPGKQSRTIYGLAISPDGYILVPANLVGTGKVFSARTTGNPPMPARLVAESASADTAVFKVSAVLSDYISGTSQKVASPGEMTIGIGPNSTFSKPNLVISQIQQTGMQQILPGGQRSENTYLADPAQKFNPEGLLFVDSQGNPLGLGLGTISNKWVIAPLSSMLAEAQKIELANGAPQGWLGIVGISASSPPNTKTPTSKGVIVYSVTSHSPAQKAGIQPNDEIVALDNEPVATLQQLQSMLAQFPSGSQVTLTIARQARTFDKTIQLGVNSQG